MKNLIKITCLIIVSSVIVSCNNDDDSDFENANSKFSSESKLLLDSIRLDTIKKVSEMNTSDSRLEDGPGPCHKWECLRAY